MKTPKNIRKLPIFGRMSLSKSQEKELDDLWSLAVKKRARMRCEIKGCFRKQGLDSHHIVGRRNKTLRHIVSNGCCLCSGHHLNLAHQRSGEFHEIMISSRGQKWWDDLQEYGRTIKVWKDYSIIKQYLIEFINDS